MSTDQSRTQVAHMKSNGSSSAGQSGVMVDGEFVPMNDTETMAEDATNWWAIPDGASHIPPQSYRIPAMWANFTGEEKAARDGLFADIHERYGADMRLDASYHRLVTDLSPYFENKRLARSFFEIMGTAFANPQLKLGMLEMFYWCAERHDFFYAPASTRFHLCGDGGLSLHSVSVLCIMQGMLEDDTDDARKARAELGPDWLDIAKVCAMFHDACKADYYMPRMEPNPRTGALYSVYPARSRDHAHGELSRAIIHSYFGDALPKVAYDAIDWHMGEYDHRLAQPKYEYPKMTELQATIAKAEYERVMNEATFPRILHAADAASAAKGL